jgi:hypothetical protein
VKPEEWSAHAAEMRRLGVRRLELPGLLTLEMDQEPVARAEQPPMTPDELRRKRYEREFGHTVSDELLKRLP